jgi:hypothetical protein
MGNLIAGDRITAQWWPCGCIDVKSDGELANLKPRRCAYHARLAARLRPE